MKTEITKITELQDNHSIAFIIGSAGQLPASLTGEQKNYLVARFEKEAEAVVFSYPEILFFHKITDSDCQTLRLEKARRAGAKLYTLLKQENIRSVHLANDSGAKVMLSFIEGILLAGYSFEKYKSEKDTYSLNEIRVADTNITQEQLDELLTVADAVCWARDLVNEPLISLNAQKLADEFVAAGARDGFSVEVFEKQKIKSLKMGGLLAVNKGSIDPPTYSVLEWKPENCRNDRPIVLAGKGIVYDTGGLSLKPTLHSMDEMKSDMGGAAAVAATISALARLKIPVHVVGLIPATDNRPDGNAITPGDVITISDGTTVEVLNTDAEGRLILADALTYAKKYNPLLVIDVATLTGSAQMVSSNHGLVALGNSPENMAKLKQSGEEVYERIIELPLWEEFGEPLKSGIADLTNVGPREGQASVAAKFLEHFTAYPWIHLDIAGPAFINENKDYRPKGGTGVGVRLLFNFLKETYPL
jgi:leucyl aminopeptidase